MQKSHSVTHRSAIYNNLMTLTAKAKLEFGFGKNEHLLFTPKPTQITVYYSILKTTQRKVSGQ